MNRIIFYRIVKVFTIKILLRSLRNKIVHAYDDNRKKNVSNF